MISDTTEYDAARQELQILEERLARLLRDHPMGSKGLTKAGVRKLIARLHEELAVFEGSAEVRQPVTP